MPQIPRLLTAALMAILVVAALSPPPPDRPQRNVLILIADDMGVGELGAYGSGPDAAPTPVLDALAASGLSFTNAWANPVCSPSRACLMTGRYSFRTGVGGLVQPDSAALPLDEWTLPEMVSDGTGGDYALGYFGKWHLGNDSVGGDLSPNLAGWDHFAGTLGNLKAPDDYFHFEKIVDGVREEVQNYATTEEVDDALAWIQSTPEPWVCVVSFHAPHKPWHIPPAGLHSIDFSQEDSIRLRYKAAVESMDTEIGRLLTGLGNRLTDTHVLFLGDNGTPMAALAAGVPFWQSKWFLFQGGVQVPFIIAGTNINQRGRTVDALVQVADVFPTIADWLRVDLADDAPDNRPIDGVSLAGYQEAPNFPPQRSWQFTEFFRENGPPAPPRAVAASDGRFKLILSSDYGRHVPEALYDLDQDPEESFNLFDAPPLSAEARAAFTSLKLELRNLFH